MCSRYIFAFQSNFLSSLSYFLSVEISRAGTVRAATIEEIEAEKSLIKKDAVSLSMASFIKIRSV